MMLLDSNLRIGITLGPIPELLDSTKISITKLRSCLESSEDDRECLDRGRFSVYI